MDSLLKNTIKGIPVIQNKQDFVIGVFPIKKILEFTKYTERLITGYDENEEPIYNKQIQRFVENQRVQKIADFLTLDPDASFPTNIVLHIPKQVIKAQEKKDGLLHIVLDEKVFNGMSKDDGDVFITIIDGQHRIKGIEEAIDRLGKVIDNLGKTIRVNNSKNLQKKLDFAIQRLNDLRDIELVVSFFIDKSLEYQAMIFSTINRTQKRVSADLVSSLFGLDTGDTPQKTALQVVLSLNGHPSSPFYKRIKLYGGDYSNKVSPPLSQATMVKSIVSLISENLREAEKDRYLNRKELTYRSSGSNKSLPFRKYYANNKDAIISDILFFYFKTVKETFRDSNGNLCWNYNNNKKTDNILQTSVGYEALLKILVDILTNSDFNEEKINETYFSSFLCKAINIDFSDQKTFPFSTKGKNILYLTLSINIWKKLDNNQKDDRNERLSKLLNE